MVLARYSAESLRDILPQFRDCRRKETLADSALPNARAAMKWKTGQEISYCRSSGLLPYTADVGCLG